MFFGCWYLIMHVVLKYHLCTHLWIPICKTVLETVKFSKQEFKGHQLSMKGKENLETRLVLVGTVTGLCIKIYSGLILDITFYNSGEVENLLIAERVFTLVKKMNKIDFLSQSNLPIYMVDTLSPSINLEIITTMWSQDLKWTKQIGWHKKSFEPWKLLMVFPGKHIFR